MNHLRNKPLLALVLWFVVVFGLAGIIALVLAQVFPHGV